MTSGGTPIDLWKRSTASARRPAATSSASSAVKSDPADWFSSAPIGGSTTPASGSGARSLRVHGEERAGGHGVHGGRATRLGDERSEVVDLTLDRLRKGVRAASAASAVVGDDGEVSCQQLRQWLEGTELPIASGRVHQDERRAGTRPLERNRGLVAEHTLLTVASVVVWSSFRRCRSVSPTGETHCSPARPPSRHQGSSWRRSSRSPDPARRAPDAGGHCPNRQAPPL